MNTLPTRVLLLVILAATLPLYAQSPGATARAALEPALETAKSWHADAVLTNVSAVGVAPDGSADAWDYIFYSPSTNSYGRLTARMIVGGAFAIKKVSNGPTGAVAENFIDSHLALATARWNGLNLRSAIMGLTSKGWAVYAGLRRGDAIVWIDAKTGAYLRTEAIPKN